ncbi:hypothetical protein BGM26_16055 [Bacillus sp. FJAT-29790]|uniref:hypothetical protein n=1 Tax=Bacillus sp. FJAT-29790 TaxID=1895002 RepID=UPI001C2502EE|nr:hypothetical protein [Bacillus sp. FJAT-29790]MBU8880468.1 hypothetical protein [Bacillus sp. FJAT-29790]
MVLLWITTLGLLIALGLVGAVLISFIKHALDSEKPKQTEPFKDDERDGLL